MKPQVDKILTKLSKNEGVNKHQINLSLIDDIKEISDKSERDLAVAKNELKELISRLKTSLNKVQEGIVNTPKALQIMKEIESSSKILGSKIPAKATQSFKKATENNREIGDIINSINRAYKNLI